MVGTVEVNDKRDEDACINDYQTNLLVFSWYEC